MDLLLGEEDALLVKDAILWPHDSDGADRSMAVWVPEINGSP